MSKTRSFFILLALCVAVGIGFLAFPSRGAATFVDGPNLSVREDILGSQWVVRDESISPNACSAIEGGVEPGLRRLVRFTVMTPNTGNRDIFVGDPNDHFEANDGLFEFASCHHHFHFRHYALYELVDPRTGKVWRAAKRGFCMLDTDPNPVPVGGVPPGPGKFRSCGAIGIPGNQGLTAARLWRRRATTSSASPSTHRSRRSAVKLVRMLTRKAFVTSCRRLTTPTTLVSR
jgi:Lysyl oxidase